MSDLGSLASLITDIETYITTNFTNDVTGAIMQQRLKNIADTLDAAIVVVAGDLTTHTHTAVNITDSTSIGRSVLTAADANTIRGIIGATSVGAGVFTALNRTVATTTILPSLSGNVGKVLTVSVGELDVEWATPSGGGGGDAWSDPVDADIVPDADGTRDLGSPSNRFAVASIDQLDLNGTTINTLEDGADVTDAANVGAAIHGSTAKTTPIDADTVAGIDSANSNALTRFTWANIKATLKAYFDAIYLTGPGSSVDSDIVLFDGTTGKLGKSAGINLTEIVEESGFGDVGMIESSGVSPIVLKDLKDGNGTEAQSNTGSAQINIKFTGANKLHYGDALGDPVEADITAAGRALLDDADATAQRTTLGLGSLATVTPTGTPDGTKFLRDDNTWQTPPGGGTLNDGDSISSGLFFRPDALNVEDTGTDHYLRINVAEDLSADRTLGIIVNDADAELTIDGTAQVSGNNTGNETTTTVGALVNGATAKTTPVDADLFSLADSAASFIIKKLSWANLKTALNGLYLRVSQDLADLNDTAAARSNLGVAVDFISGHIETAADKSYVLDLYAAYAYTINELKIVSASGTVTAAVTIDAVNVTGISSVSVSSSEATGTASAANSVAVGNTVRLVFTSNSSALDVAFTLKITRA